jgi:hypothetical protein
LRDFDANRKLLDLFLRYSRLLRTGGSSFFESSDLGPGGVELFAKIGDFP